MKFAARMHELLRRRLTPGRRAAAALLILMWPAFLVVPCDAVGSAYHFIRATESSDLFALDPDLTVGAIDPSAPRGGWSLAEGKGLPPFYYRTRVPGGLDRTDFFYPLGRREETLFRSRLKFTPFFESTWSKVPPFDGYSRCLTVFHGRSDLGQEYWGVFPFYGYTYRRSGVDRNFFLLFPLYYESSDDNATTVRLLWPLITYANSPERQSFKVWPLFGKDSIRNDYSSTFFLWPFFQATDKYMGKETESSYRALLFPLYVRQDNLYSTSTSLVWPLMAYYRHYASGHTRYTFRPFFTYGSGGGIEELNILYLYSHKKDHRRGTSSTGSDGYISVGEDEVSVERKFLFMSSIQKRYRKGALVFSKYKFWPFAEYSWDFFKGSHWKFPEVIPLKGDWWDVNLGRMLRLVDLRDTPLTREISFFFGLSRRTEMKTVPHISRPPRPGEDDWAELISGSFGKR